MRAESAKERFFIYEQVLIEPGYFLAGFSLLVCFASL
jgi:hypothetical protein